MSVYAALPLMLVYAVMKADAPLLLIFTTSFDKGSALLCRSYKGKKKKKDEDNRYLLLFFVSMLHAQFRLSRILEDHSQCNLCTQNKTILEMIFQQFPIKDKT